MKNLHESTLKELEDYKGSRLKYKRLYEKTLLELEDYKGSRLKYKRLHSFFEYKYNKITNSTAYKISKVISLPFTYPFYLKTQIFRKITAKKTTNIDKKQKSSMDSTINKDQETSKTIQKKDIENNPKIKDFLLKKSHQSTTLIYADINLNVVDGSSIWLSSVYNLFSLKSNIIILSKANIENDLIISNFIKNKSNHIIIEPKDIGLANNLNVREVSKILNIIDTVIPDIQNLLMRGIESITEVAQNNNFKNRLLPYITNIYTPTLNGPKVNDFSDTKITLISHITKTWLWQTDELKTFAEHAANINLDNSIIFPPILPEIKPTYSAKKSSSYITIGYAGKIQPDWGVLELLEETEKLLKLGFKLKLKIISSKISWRSSFGDGKGFPEKIRSLLKKEHIEFIQNVNREESLNLLSSVDFIWSFRPKYFEENTLELSTKLLEALALGIPTITYPSQIHKKLMGDDYPYYLSDINNLNKLLTLKNDKEQFLELAKKVKDNYSLNNHKNLIQNLFVEKKEKKITIASNDYKFINHFYSNLKSNGSQVTKDLWEWGKTDSIESSKKSYQESDIIFCEWGLANAAWYSQINTKQKPLFIRIHAQEVRQKAMRFSKGIDVNNVEKFIFVSEKIRQKALELYSWPTDKTIVIPNYILNNDFKISDERKKRNISFNFGLVGITPQTKRLDRAIDLMEIILKKYPSSKLYIKGERPENYSWMHAPGRIQELDFYYEQYNRLETNDLLKKAIIFDGFGNDMPEWYQKIDFILSPSDAESFHYGLADGVSSGCIPIIWPWDGAEDTYTSEWVIKDTHTAVEKVNTIQALPLSKINEIRDHNYQLISDKYGYKTIYKQLENIMEIE